jgi:class 3 adenylate cyclase
VDDTRCLSCDTELATTAKFCSECGTPVARVARAAEYKQVTILFADVVGSMDIAKRVGPERLREIMADLVDRASGVVQRYGGTVDKFTGDGIMAVFGAPVALEDHAVRGCLAALGIQAAVADVDLELRIGLNSGQVIAGEIGSHTLGYTAVGEHVGMAQRMESVAPPGGVMLSASTARLVDEVAILREADFVAIKGAAEPVPARQLLGVDQHGRHPNRPESNFVGRGWEMSAVQGLLDRAIDGRGAVVSIVGPPGIGKSRLSRELATHARRRNVDVFSTYCESHTSQVPFQVVSRLLRSATGVEDLDADAARDLIESQAFSSADPEDVALFEDLLGVPDPDVDLTRITPDARKRRLTALINSATLATSTPAVYLIEDAHWIDESSESMLAAFLAVVPQAPLLTVITYRPEYRGALANVPGSHTLTLAPLSDAETTLLVSTLLGSDASIGGLGKAIVEKASGTPFFAEEIVQELAERGVLHGRTGSYVSTAEPAEVSVPATLQATLASRIDRLDPSAKRTLGAASVVGSRFGVDLLAELGIDPVMEDLVAAQLIDQVVFTDTPEYVFHHPLVRAVAYETQLKSDRAELHRRVASAIEHRTSGSPDENAALIGAHLESAGDLHAAFAWHMRAGSWSTNRDIAAARTSWERARRVADALPDDDPNRLEMRIAPRTALRATDWRVHAEDSAAHFGELRELCALAGDKASLALAMMGPMGEQSQRGNPQGALQLAIEQIALLDSIGNPVLAAQAAFGAMAIRAQFGEMHEVLRWAQTTIDSAGDETAPDNLVLGSPLAAAFALRGVARSWFGMKGWRADLDTGVALAERTDEPFTLAVTTSWKYGTGVFTGVVCADDLAVQATERALQTLESSGDDYAVAMFKWVFASALLWRDAGHDRQRGRELLHEVREISERERFLGSEIPVMDMYIGWERARDGDVDGGLELLRTAVHEMIDRGQVGYYLSSGAILVETLALRGAPDDIAEAGALIETLQNAPVDGSVVRDVWVLRLHALLARAKGDDTAYRDYRNRYREMATSLGFEGHMQWAAAML